MSFFAAYNTAYDTAKGVKDQKLAEARTELQDRTNAATRLERMKQAEANRKLPPDEFGLGAPEVQYTAPDGPAQPAVAAPTPEATGYSNSTDAMRAASRKAGRRPAAAATVPTEVRPIQATPEGVAVFRDLQARRLIEAKLRAGTATPEEKEMYRAKVAAQQTNRPRTNPPPTAAPSTPAATPGAAQQYRTEAQIKGAANQDMGVAPGAYERVLQQLQADYQRVPDAASKAMIAEEIRSVQGQMAKYAGAAYIPGATAPAPAITPTAAQPQAPAAPQYTGPRYSDAQVAQQIQQGYQRAAWQMDRIKELAQVTSDPKDLLELRGQYMQLQSQVREAQLDEAFSRGQLSQDQYRMLSLKEQQRAAAEAADWRKARIKAEGEAYVEGVKGNESRATEEVKLNHALTKFLTERNMTANDIAGISRPRDGVGPIIVYTKGNQVLQLTEPDLGNGVKGVPRLVPYVASAG